MRFGKGNKTRVVPLNPELEVALRATLEFGEFLQGSKLVPVTRFTASRWMKVAVEKAVERGAIAPGRKISTHTLRHSFARHMLMHRVLINYLSRWMGHSSIQTTLIHLELVPDPEGSIRGVP